MMESWIDLTNASEASSPFEVILEQDDEDKKPSPAQKRSADAIHTCDDDNDDNVALVPRKRSRHHPKFECSICLEASIPWEDGIHLDSCGHSYCKQCLRDYVKSKISDKAVESHQLVCPDTTCRLPLESSDIRASTLLLGDAASWREYEEVATLKFLESAVASSNRESLRRCPAERCNFTFQYDPEGSPNGHLFICPECDNAFCLNCPVVGGGVGPAHDGTCGMVLEEIRHCEEKKRKLEEWKKLNAQADTRFNDLLEKERDGGITKPCPNCNTPITKNQGCDHMHCTVCSTDYNWSEA